MVAAIEHYTCVMGRLVFDVHEHVSGSRLQRATAMLGVVLMLSLRWIQGVRFLMRRGRDPVRVLARPDVYHPYP